MEVLVGNVDRIGMRPNCSVCDLEKKHRFANFLCHRHQAAIMLEQSQAAGILSDGWGVGDVLTKNTATVLQGHAVQPTIISLHRSVAADTVLLSDLAGRFPFAWGQRECRVALGP